MSNSISVTQLITEAHDHQKGKVCSRPKCKQHNPQPLSEFSKKRDTKDGLQFKCKSCNKEYDDNRCPFKRWFASKKGRVKADGVEFTIEPEDIPGVKIRRFKVRGKWIYETTEYPKVCLVMGTELDWGQNGNQPNSPSLDRIDPTKGYVKGNVMMMSDLANRMKQNATPEELTQFCRYHLFGE